MSMTPSRNQVEAYKLRHAAADGRLFIVRCSLCKWSMAYLASDLAQVWNPETAAVHMPFHCLKCGRDDYIRAKMRMPSSDDVGHLRVRRPAGVRTVQLWREEWYG